MTDQRPAAPDYDELLEQGIGLDAQIRLEYMRVVCANPRRSMDTSNDSYLLLALLDRHLAQRVRELADEAPLQMPGPHKTYTMALRFRHCGRGEPRFNFETEEDSRDDG